MEQKTKSKTNLHKVMTQKGFTQKDLMETLKVSQPMASLLMSGKRNLGFGQALLLSKRLDVEPAEIYGFEPEEQVPVNA